MVAVITDGDERSETNAERETGESNGADAGFDIDGERLTNALWWGALFGFGILILVAGAGLYGSLGSVIDVWVADRYQPVARAGVNFALLCASIGGLVWTSRRL